MAVGYMDTNFKLVTPDPLVEASFGDDVTLPCHLSPKTSAVAMEIRWFKGTDCIYLYKNGHVTDGWGYEGRVSVNTQELQRGDVSLRLRLRESGWGDTGVVYTCQVISGEHKENGRVGVTNPFGWFDWWFVGEEMKREITAEERKMEDSVQSLVFLPWRKATDDELMKKINQLENMTSEVETSRRQLESLEKELQDRNSQQQDLRTQLQEQGRELEERDRQLEERNRQLEERDRQLEERDRQLEERERKHLTDPDPPPVRKRHSKELDPPNMGGESPVDGPDPPPVRRRHSKELDPANMGGESPGPAPPVSPSQR